MKGLEVGKSRARSQRDVKGNKKCALQNATNGNHCHVVEGETSGVKQRTKHYKHCTRFYHTHLAAA
jgi:hypothetical protein